MRAFLIGAALAAMCLSLSPAVADAADGDGIRIDVPVVLDEARVVFNLDHLAFEGDEPTGLAFLRVMTERFKAEGTRSRIVAIFHGAAGYMLLNDEAYNRVRNWGSGNPYKDQIARLIRDGVEVEECGQTMRDKHWRNVDLLDDVKVNSGANFRIIQLVKDGFVQIQP